MKPYSLHFATTMMIIGVKLLDVISGSRFQKFCDELQAITKPEDEICALEKGKSGIEKVKKYVSTDL